MNKNCPVCESDSKDVHGGFSVCKKCGNVYIPMSEIPREYPPKDAAKISTTLEDTHMVENARLLTELIYNYFKDNVEDGCDYEYDSRVLSDRIQEKFEVKKKSGGGK